MYNFDLFDFFLFIKEPRIFKILISVWGKRRLTAKSVLAGINSAERGQ